MRRYEAPGSFEYEYEEHLFVLHGRVMEYLHKGIPWESRRMHVSRLAVYVEGPDRKGRTEFRFQPLDVQTHRVTVKLPPEQVDPMRRFVAAMTAARDDPGDPA
jgi:hypothetical protein